MASSSTLEITIASYSLLTKFWNDELADEEVQSLLFTPPTESRIELEYDRAILNPTISKTVEAINHRGLGANPRIKTMSLRFSDTSNWSLDDWHATFGSLRCLRHINIVGSAANGFVCFLSARYSPASDDTEAEAEINPVAADIFPFNRLTHIALSSVDLSGTIVDDSGQPQATSVIDELLSEVHIRHQHASKDGGTVSRIQWLSIQSCTVLEDWVELLRDYVDHVEWDGYTGGLVPALQY